MRRSLVTVSLLVASWASCASCACGRRGPEITRVRARPATPPASIAPGLYPLGAAPGWVHGVGLKHGGQLHVPARAKAGTQVPLLLLLHGGGGRAEDFRQIFPLADEFGVAIAALDSRDNTWDAIDSPWGPDVVAIDRTLQFIFERVAIDPARVAIGGISDGGFYALSLGLANGDLFTHVIAVAPGYHRVPGTPSGRPKILLAHGTRDNVYSVSTSLRLVPALKRDGYDVTFREFDGPHSFQVPLARDVLAWLQR